MKGDMGMKAKKIFYYIPFIVIWCFIAVAIRAAYDEGVLSVIKDAFGNVGISGLSLLGIIAFSSVIYLHLFIKKEWKIQLTAYLLTILFCAVSVFSVNMGEKRFEKFSMKSWSIRLSPVSSLSTREVKKLSQSQPALSLEGQSIKMSVEFCLNVETAAS